MTLSSGPSVELTVYRPSTDVGSPHRAAPVRSMYAGQSRNITLASIGNPRPVVSCIPSDTEGGIPELIQAGTMPAARKPGRPG